jgi:cytidylate kinase
MYRAVTLAALDTGVDMHDARAVSRLAGLAARMTDDPRLRTPLVDARVSLAASHPEVRAALHAAQRSFLEDGDAVAEGRDVGSVVWPEAEVKVWLDADPRERARRRSAEQAAADAEVASALVDRDRRDAQNMLRAPEAHVLDTTRLPVDEVVQQIVGLVERARA